MDIITIGDAMISMCPEKKVPLMFADRFERKIGGAEINVAIGCARLGIESGWISKLGNDDFGKYILKSVRGEGVDVSQVELVDYKQTSVYFREILSNGSSRSFYYRENSPTSAMNEEDLIETYFENSKILHITGVFPSICKNNQEIIKRAIKLAKKYGLLISFDPNIRLKIWSKEEAKIFILSILKDVDILLIGDEEIEIIFDNLSIDEALVEFYDYGIDKVVIKRGAKGAIGYDGEKTYPFDSIPPKAVVDTVGAGDGFAAGFLTSIIKGYSFEDSIQFANAVGSLVVGVEGDNEGLPYYEDVLEHLGKIKKIER